jgi:hypothetical protein
MIILQAGSATFFDFFIKWLVFNGDEAIMSDVVFD